MGQYFKAVNLDKREVVCPWCIGGGAKLWEWAANTQGAIFSLLASPLLLHVPFYA